MKDIASLIQHIEKIIPLDDEARQALAIKVTSKKIRRRQYLLQDGDICRHYNFVLNGCLRMYLVDEKGTEHVLQFAIEGGWIADIGSLHTDQPSHFCIDALEPTEVLRIAKEDLIDLYVKHPAFDRYFRVLTENAFVGMQQRVMQNISSTAETRYLLFLEKYPHLFNRIPLVQIASFIGVTPEFLSKIRRNLMA
ncbi:MAG: cyclic nucleotide-binding domain-containing protein [Bacteroidetes bacterium]|nr:cyclic nucleotide-binding domain-containing protein [Bacteroidota bacterium]